MKTQKQKLENLLFLWSLLNCLGILYTYSLPEKILMTDMTIINRTSVFYPFTECFSYVGLPANIYRTSVFYSFTYVSPSSPFFNIFWYDLTEFLVYVCIPWTFYGFYYLWKGNY